MLQLDYELTYPDYRGMYDDVWAQMPQGVKDYYKDLADCLKAHWYDEPRYKYAPSMLSGSLREQVDGILGVEEHKEPAWYQCWKWETAQGLTDLSSMDYYIDWCDNH